MNVTRKMRSRDLIRICLRRNPAAGSTAAPRVPAPRPPRRPATNWPVTRNASVAPVPCAAQTGAEGSDSSAPTADDADADPPSPGHLARYATCAAVLVLGGALLLGFSASPAGAQESGGDGGSTSSGSSSSGDGGDSSGGMSSSLSSGMSSSDGGMSSSGYGSSGYGSSDSGMSGSSFSSDTGGGYSSDGTVSSSFSSTDSGLSSTSSFSSTDTATTDSGYTSSYSGTTDSAYGSISSDTGYAGSDTGTTGFEGSPEVGPAHAVAVNTNASTYNGTDSGLGSGETGMTDSSVSATRAISTDTSSYSSDTSSYSADTTGYAGSDTGTTGFEGSPEVGPAHAVAVNTDSPTWTGETYTTGFEGSPELGPVLAQDMLAAEALGRFDAAEVALALSALGVDPNRFDPTQLRNLLSPGDPRYGQLVDAIQALAHEIQNPLRGDDRIAGPYAARVYEGLDVDGTRALLGAIDQMAYNRAWFGAPPDADVRTAMLDPMAAGFALATESPIAPMSVFDGLRNIESRWQQHQLAQLLNAGFTYDPATNETRYSPRYSYDPTQLAQFANAVVDYGRTHQLGVYPSKNPTPDPAFGQVYGLDALNPVVNPAALMYTGPYMWNGDVTMQVPEALALRALSVNPEASWQFTDMSPENLATVVRPSEGFRGYWGYATDEGGQLRGLMDQYGADVVRGALIDAVGNELSRYPAALDRYADVTRLMARDVRTSDPVRQAFVDVLGAYFATPEGRLVGSYIDDIGNAAVTQRNTRYATEAERMAQDFNRVDLVNAFREVGMSEQAAHTLGQVMTAWTAVRAAGFLDDDNLQQSEVNTALRPNALVLDTIRQGFEDIGVPTANQQALSDSIKYYGSIMAAIAGPVANAFGGMGQPVLATGAGITGSLTWAGSTYMADRVAQTTPPPFHGDDFARALTGALRESTAAQLAARRGESPPTPSQLQSTLDRAFPEVGDPFDSFIDLSANEGYLNARRGTHWSH